MSDGTGHFPAGARGGQDLIWRDLHSEGTQKNGRRVTHQDDDSIDLLAPTSLPNGTVMLSKMGIYCHNLEY